MTETRTDGITVRAVEPRDYERVGDLTVTAYRAAGPLRDEYAAVLRDVASRAEKAEVLVAVDERDVAIGTVTYVPGPGPYAEFDDPDEAGVRMLAVDPAAQGRGAGARLARECVERARAGGRRRIALYTQPWMTAAHRIYERLGFRRAPERDWDVVPDVHLLAYVLELS